MACRTDIALSPARNQHLRLPGGAAGARNTCTRTHRPGVPDEAIEGFPLEGMLQAQHHFRYVAHLLRKYEHRMPCVRASGLNCIASDSTPHLRTTTVIYQFTKCNSTTITG